MDFRFLERRKRSFEEQDRFLLWLHSELHSDCAKEKPLQKGFEGAIDRVFLLADTGVISFNLQPFASQESIAPCFCGLPMPISTIDSNTEIRRGAESVRRKAVNSTTPSR